MNARVVAYRFILKNTKNCYELYLRISSLSAFRMSAPVLAFNNARSAENVM